jgi:hypothetical protein
MKVTRQQLDAVSKELAMRLRVVIREQGGEGRPPVVPENAKRFCFDPSDVRTILYPALRAANIEVEVE